MPGNVHVRNLYDDFDRKIEAVAARRWRSPDAEYREIVRQALADEVESSFEALAADLRRLTTNRHQTHRKSCCAKGARSGEGARP